jgi:peptide chain release factor 3
VPLYFGSALTNFGVEPFLDDFLPSRRCRRRGRWTTASCTRATTHFRGFVFKIQANMDPRHRDRIAFVRVCSGHFEAGLQATLGRTRKPLRLNCRSSSSRRSARRWKTPGPAM